MPFEIPDSWNWTRLKFITYNHGQKVPDKKFSYIDICSIDNTHQKLNQCENIIEPDNAPSRARKIVQRGDILYATVRPYLHNMCIVDKNFLYEPIASTGFAVLAVEHGIENVYLFYFMLSDSFDGYANKSENSKGVAYPAINDDKLYKALIPIPPLEEQARIVKRIEELFVQIDIIDQNQADIDNLYEEFRKRTLTLAIQGKLVPQDPNDEPASVLLERIRAEKKAKLGKKFVDSYIYKGDDNCYYEHIAGREQDELVEVPFDIPDNWAWSRIDGVAFLQSGKPFEELESGTPYVKVSDMNLSENNIEITTSQHYCKATSRDIIPASSIIFPKRGGAISTNKKRKVLSFNCCIDLNTMCMTPFLPQMLGYLFSWFLTIDLGMMHDGTSVPQINNVDIYPLLVPIPPLAEQKRIVAKINEIFAML